MDIEDISLPEGVQIRKQPSPKKSRSSQGALYGFRLRQWAGATRQQACTMLSTFAYQRAEQESLRQHRSLAEPPYAGAYPYVYVDGIYLKRNWGGEYENVAALAAIAVNEDGYREVLGATEGMKEDKASWVSFFHWLRERGAERRKVYCGRQVHGDVGDCRRSVSRGKIPAALYILPEGILCCARIQGKRM